MNRSNGLNRLVIFSLNHLDSSQTHCNESFGASSHGVNCKGILQNTGNRKRAAKVGYLHTIHWNIVAFHYGDLKHLPVHPVIDCESKHPSQNKCIKTVTVTQKSTLTLPWFVITCDILWSRPTLAFQVNMAYKNSRLIACSGYARSKYHVFTVWYHNCIPWYFIDTIIIIICTKFYVFYFN